MLMPAEEWLASFSVAHESSPIVYGSLLWKAKQTLMGLK